MKIKNCTPHVINFVENSGEVISFPPSGIIPRVEFPKGISTRKEIEGIPSFPIFTKQEITGKIINLPEKEEGIFLFVSLPVFLATEREDIIAGDNQIRNEKGQITGISSFLCH